MPRRPSRFDNRPSPPTRSDALLSSAEVCARLGVKRATLYTYVSRGLIRSVAGAGHRRLYAADDVERVASKAAARRGHRAVAAGALRFGDPVLDTRITAAGPDRLLYRGRNVVDLVEAGVSFEAIAALLWARSGEGDLRAWPWPKGALLKGVSPTTPIWWRWSALLPRLAPQKGDDLSCARRLIRAFAAVSGRTPGPTPKGRSIARTLRLRFGLAPTAEPALDAALGLVADHELNVSTFAARVAASGGAELYACVGAALYAFSGDRHGGAAATVAAFVDQVGEPARAKAAVRARLEAGQHVPGYGHPLYPHGDPRGPPLVEWALRLAPERAPRLRVLLAIDDAMRAIGSNTMNVDAGLLALAYALGLRADDASAIFGVGRTAGWVAHIFEQRETGVLLRPRARYVGPFDATV